MKLIDTAMACAYNGAKLAILPGITPKSGQKSSKKNKKLTETLRGCLIINVKRKLLLEVV